MIATGSWSSDAVMLLDLRGVARAVAALGFLLLFPGFVLYHYASASGWIQPLLGGLFGIVSLGVALLSMPILPWLLRAQVWGGVPQAQFIILSWIYFLVWTITGAISISGEAHAGAALRESASMLVFWVAMFFIGSFYGVDSRVQRSILFVVAAMIAAFMLHAVVVQGSLLGPYLVFQPDEASDAVISTYQSAGRSIMVTAILVAALIRQPWLQAASLALASIALLAVGSRAHLFTTLCLLITTVTLSAFRARSRLALIAFTLVTAAGVISMWSLFMETRAAEILDLSTSSSWQGRLDVQALAFDVVASNPLSGDFAYHLREVGEGGYAHNALSAWTQFGLIGFALYCSLIAYFTVLSLFRVLATPMPGLLWQVSWGLNFASVVLAIAAEPVFSVVPPLAWGFTVNALLKERRWRKVLVRV